MCVDTCHPPTDRPHSSAVPDWARRHPLATVPGAVAGSPSDRDGAATLSAERAGVDPAAVPARSSVVDAAGTRVVGTAGTPAVDVPRARVLALAVCVDVLLAELVAERRRRRAIVDRYEYVLERRAAHPPESTGDDGGLARIREWFTG